MFHEKRVKLKGSEIHPLPGSQKSEITPPVKEIEVSIHLRYHPAAAPLPTMEELSLQLPVKRKRLTHEEYEAQYGAAPQDVAMIEDFAHEFGLEVKQVNFAHRLVVLSGTVEHFNQAFGVTLHDHYYPEARFRTHEGDVSVPLKLGRIVDGVFGLDDMPAAKPHIPFRAHTAETSGSEPDPLAGKFYPNQVTQFYHFPTHLTGKGESIAIITLGGGYELSNIEAYFKTLGIPMPKITGVPVAGAQNHPFTQSKVTDLAELRHYLATAETYLDIEIAGVAAPGAEIVVYIAPNTYKGFLEALKLAVHDPDHDNSIVSISWGFSEKNWGAGNPVTGAFNQTLHEAAVKGITVCAASGDFGSSNEMGDTETRAYVDFPAASPFVLACGGTSVFVDNGQIKKETVWKEDYQKLDVEGFEIPGPMTLSTGGGVSEIFDCPVYQTKASVSPKSVNPGHKTGRGVPDISGNADMRSGYIVRINKKLTAYAGTSSVAPLYAGLIARINQKLGQRVGFLTPLLYLIGDSQNVFNDITEGNNVTAKNGGYYAKEGWDACTGWGSVNGENLLRALEQFYDGSGGTDS